MEVETLLPNMPEEQQTKANAVLFPFLICESGFSCQCLHTHKYTYFHEYIYKQQNKSSVNA